MGLMAGISYDFESVSRELDKYATSSALPDAVNETLTELLGRTNALMAIAFVGGDVVIQQPSRLVKSLEQLFERTSSALILQHVLERLRVGNLHRSTGAGTPTRRASGNKQGTRKNKQEKKKA